MPVRPIIHYPHPVLKSAAEPIEPGTRADAITDDLVDTMLSSPACVGLAAPQIGEPVRAFCLDVSSHRRAKSSHGLLVVLNPQITIEGATDVLREGCMSLPDFTGNVRRAISVRLTGITPAGDEIAVAASGFEARAIQHEVDHLDGLLFVDRLSSLTADLFPRMRYAGPGR